MVTLLKITYESIIQAIDSMAANKLRTFLSLLGITIGIFCIIAVKSAVDSLEDSIKSSFNQLGTDVIYLDKMPWNEDPGQNFWKYAQRPNPSFADYEAIKAKSEKAKNAAFTIFTGGRTIKFRSSAVSNATIMGTTYEYQEIQNLEIEKGRYFTNSEYNTGANKIILGASIAESLFPSIEPIGKEVKLFGQTYNVIGIVKQEGDNLFNIIPYDEVLWVSYNNVKRFVNTGDDSMAGRLLNIQAKKDGDLEELKGEITGIIRANRRLSPLTDDNFAINEVSMLSQVLDSVFGVINIAGLAIGVFALIVGMFSVANIMFVSVKERTSIIGIKKALGAKSFIVLMEFLIEAIILCLLGGLIGLALVYIILTGISTVIPFKMTLGLSNMLVGVSVSILVGIISGFIPALRASNMSPVEAMRSS